MAPPNCYKYKLTLLWIIRMLFILNRYQSVMFASNINSMRFRASGNDCGHAHYLSTPLIVQLYLEANRISRSQRLKFATLQLGHLSRYMHTACQFSAPDDVTKHPNATRPLFRKPTGASQSSGSTTVTFCPCRRKSC